MYIRFAISSQFIGEYKFIIALSLFPMKLFNIFSLKIKQNKRYWLIKDGPHFSTPSHYKHLFFGVVVTEIVLNVWNRTPTKATIVLKTKMC